MGNHPNSDSIVSPPILLLAPKITLPNLICIASNSSNTLSPTSATSIPYKILGKHILSQIIFPSWILS